MDEIYSRVKDSIVWIGEGKDETKAAANTWRNMFVYFLSTNGRRTRTRNLARKLPSVFGDCIRRRSDSGNIQQ
jgi:hypothetical protein